MSNWPAIAMSVASIILSCCTFWVNHLDARRRRENAELLAARAHSEAWLRRELGR